MKTILLCLVALTLPYTMAGQVFTVEAEGYTGTNPTVDIAAFNLALSKARAAGGSVVLECGVYTLQHTLYLETDDVLIGQGSQNTTIQFTAPLTYHVTNGPNQNGYAVDARIHVEGLTIETMFRENMLYYGLRLWGVDYPVVRDVLVRNVSVGHAILFRNNRYAEPGDIDRIRAENSNFSVDPEYDPTKPSKSRQVIHFSGCKNLVASNLQVTNSRSSAPGLDRDAISCGLSENVTLRGIRGEQINTLLDAGFNLNCVFEDFFGTDINFIPVYSNNGNQGCVFRNGKFVNTDYGIYVKSAATGVNDVEAFNLYQNFDFWNIGSFGVAREGIWVGHNSPQDPSRAPHDNRFMDIQFVDTNITPGISRVVLEKDYAVGKNTYKNCTVETPYATTPISERITGAVYGPNLQGFEEKIGFVDVNFTGFTAKAWQSGLVTIPNVSKILGVTVGISSEAPGDPVQHINVSVRAISGNTFRMVVTTTDNTGLDTKVTQSLRLTYRALCE